MMDEIEPDLEIAKRILADPSQKDRSVLNVAFDAGFYHLRTFNKKFKRETAMCPIEYRAYHIKFKEVMGMTPDEYQELNDPSSEEL